MQCSAVQCSVDHCTAVCGSAVQNNVETLVQWVKFVGSRCQSWNWILVRQSPTLYTAHCTLHIIHCTLHTSHSLQTAHCIFYNAHCTLQTTHYTLHTVHCTLYTALCTAKCTLHTEHFTDGWLWLPDSWDVGLTSDWSRIEGTFLCCTNLYGTVFYYSLHYCTVI